jgi:hypothetical protein
VRKYLQMDADVDHLDRAFVFRCWVDVDVGAAVGYVYGVRYT